MDVSAFSIPDSTDWLNTSLAGFAPLESALRCQVCKDFFDTPMMTSCSHTFCSLCIRRCFAADGRCPTCRAADQDSKLRRNNTAQELVEAFQAARPQALELARKSAAASETESSGDAKTATTTKRGKSNRKRKLGEAGDGEDAERGPARKTRSQARRSATSSQTPEVIDLDDYDNGESDSVAEEGMEEVQPEDGLVACPMCNKRMKEEAVFPHLDRCEGPDKDGGSSRATRARQSQTIASSHPLQQRTRNGAASSRTQDSLSRLPQLNYSLLKDQALRKKLADLGIPASGTRAQQIRRHTEWVNLWNANVDSLRPKTKRELLIELDKWERSQNMESGGGGIIGAASGVQVMKKDFDGDGWAKTNKSHFDELIANARAKRSAPKAESGAEEEKNKQHAETNGATPQESTANASQEPQPYEGNEEALEKVRSRVDAAARRSPMLPHRNSNIMEGEHNVGGETPAQNVTETSYRSNQTATSPSNQLRRQSIPSSLPEHLASPGNGVREKPMFEMPSESVMDVDTAADR
ncbi:Zinc finger RING-type protein [Macrophomina phaseolina MS6]|uniref:Postreplication repair E3 ubiquitin-protein ligase RAD18 n=1 Tax=Macrophomina phaseolina (strain MS6) TaxID=1126212 RepID=K2R3C5_MACPH|nr:Zinc finger RING-type protein [Macrophomina phaseolina MS6]